MNLRKPPLNSDKVTRARRTNIALWVAALIVLTIAGSFFTAARHKHSKQQSAQALNAAVTQPRVAEKQPPPPPKEPPTPPPPEPPLEPLPPVKKHVIQRISSYTDDYGSSQREYVAVKFRDENDINRYAVDSLWALAREGDIIVFTPSYSGREIVWTTSIILVDPPKAKTENMPQ